MVEKYRVPSAGIPGSRIFHLGLGRAKVIQFVWGKPIASFQAGQVGMLYVSDPAHPLQTGIVNLGVNAGPHVITLSDDDKRLVVSDYFLNEDNFGKIHFEGDHKVHVIKIFKDHLELDPRFVLDFNTAFPTGPARPHGTATK